jgi:hypothetical protein
MARGTNLLASMQALARVLGEAEDLPARTWAARVDDALAAVEESWRASQWDLPGMEEEFGGMALSPGADRRARSLRRELDELVGEASHLRAQMRRVVSGDTAASPHMLVGFRLEAQALLEALRAHEREEASFVQELVTTDIGAGD